MRRPSLLFFSFIAWSSAAAAADSYGPLRALMGCTTDPTPSVVVEDLLEVGLLTDRQDPRVDEDYGWRVTPGLSWDGIEFSRLCVVTDDPAELVAHSAIYWSGSIAPWTEVWLLTGAGHDVLKNWATATLPVGSRYEIDQGDTEDMQTALSCSEWWFPLQH